MDMDVAGPAYWRANLESPVRFSDAITGLVDSDDVQVLLEVGPHPALKSPIDQILKKADKSSVAYRSTLKRQQDGRESMLQLAGGLFCLNADIDLAAVNAVDGAHGGLEHGSIAVDLPPYQYAYGLVAYHESRQSKEYRHRQVTRHDLLGSKVAGNAKLRPQWRNVLRVKDVPWLADHRLLPDAVFPAAGYVALAVEAARRIQEEFPTQVPISGYSLREVSIKSSLPVPEDDFGVEIMTSMEIVDVATAQSPAWASFPVSSVTRESEEWTEHCTGLAMIQLSEPDPAALLSTSELKTVGGPVATRTGGRAINADNWYKKFAAIGLGCGKTYQPLSDIRADPQSSSTNDQVLGLSTGEIQVGNRARVPSALALKLQPNDDRKQLVTLPRAYATAIYALEHIAHLPPGDPWTGKTVLVQSATTQVGQALIALIKAKGADVYAVVSSAEAASFLAKKTGLSSSFIFASQDPATGLRRAAAATQKGEKGSFDIILSTERTDLEFLFMTPRLLRPLGQLIHAGRIEGQKAQVAGGLDMGLLSEKGTTFSVVDLAVALDSNARLGGQLLQTVDKYYRRGLIKPSGPFGDQVTDVTDLSRVLADFSKSEVDTGKLVVTFEKPEAQVKMVPPFPSAKLDSDAWYVITGALGGLAQSIVRWMVNHGARHLLLLSRRAIDRVPDAQRLVTNLASHGVEVRPEACDITDLAQVKSAISSLSSSSSSSYSSLPVRGVVHAAVSWQDLSFDKLTLARWRDSLAAKVRGTKNLHEATLAQPLEFFVMTTSLLSVYALATQAAYTAANNFQDGFARHRGARGLPASTVAFSLIRDVGATGSEQATVDTFERNRTLTLSEQQFLALLEPAFLPRAADGQGADPLSAANLITCLDPAAMVAKTKTRDGGAPAGSTPRWYGDGRVAPIIRAFADAQQNAQDQLSGDAGADGSGAKSRTAQLQQELEAGVRGGAGQGAATVALVENAIAETVAEMLFIDREAVDPAKSVADYGVDSLIAAELRTWFVEALKTDISMLKLLDQSTSIVALAAKIVDDSLTHANTSSGTS